MGNGFPIGGVLIHPDFKPVSGMLGTTFGGNYLACAAGLAVIEVIEKQRLMENAAALGLYWHSEISKLPVVGPVRGKGLMIGFDLPPEKKDVRNNLLLKHRIFTGEAKPNTIRLLPSLALKREEAELFIAALKKELE
jgi:acetylornithine/N-succinyldiaminopimelate aminotransferase